MRHFLLTTGVLFSVALVGCSQSPQEQYDAAVESVNEAQSAIKDAKKKVDKTNEKIAAARKDHQKAQQALNEKQETLREARSKAQKQASDEILFRVLQRDVLTKDAFEKSAISVSVDQRVVTLTGSVPDADTRDEAVKLSLQHKWATTRDPELLRQSFDEMVENVRHANGIAADPDGYVMAAHWALNMIKVATVR